MRISVPAGWLVQAVFVAAIAVAPGARAGDTVPIDGVLVPGRVAVDVGQTVAFRLNISASATLGRVGVRLKVPEGMTLVAGSVDAEIDKFVPGENRVFEYRLRLDAPGEKKVWIIAEVLGIAPAIMRSPFLAVVNPADADKPPPTIVRDRQGNTYQVQSIPFKPSP